MKIMIVTVIALFIFGFIPIWPKSVKNGTIKVNTWTKVQLVLGWVHID